MGKKKKNRKPRLSPAQLKRPDPDSRAIQLRSRIRALEEALQVFAHLPIEGATGGTHFYVYRGNAHEGVKPDFTVQDLIRARELLDEA